MTATLGTSPAPISSARTSVEGWLERFDEALTAGDGQAVAALFGAECSGAMWWP